MRKVLKYIPVLIITCLVGFVLFSCRGKKVAAQETDAAPESTVPDGVNVDAWFAHMYVDGCAQRMKGNLQEALRLFGECVKIKPENPAVHYELGTIHKLLGNNQLALQHAKYCAGKTPENEWYQLLLIDCYRVNNQYGMAIRTRENLVKKYPARSDFKEDLAIDYAMTGQFEKSFRIYEELESEYGVNEQITMNKVKLLESQKKIKDIEKELLKLSATDKYQPQYYAYLAEYYNDQKEPEKARAMYDKILEIDPANPQVHLALHDHYSEKGETKLAFEHLRKAFLNPDLEISAKAGIVNSFFSRAQNKNTDALNKGKELAQLMLQVHPRAPESNSAIADFLTLEKKTKEALPYLYTAAMNERRDPGVWEDLLKTENELRMFDSLQKHSSTAIELFPNRAVNYLYNGLAALELGEPAKAARSLHDGLEFVFDNKSLKTDFLRLLGDAYHRAGEHSKSDEAFESVLKLDADNVYVLNNYAYYLALRGHNLEHAARLSKQSLQLQPSNRNYMDTYGLILYKQKKYEAAEEWLSKASSTGPPSPVILEHYGDVLYRLDRVSEANSAWNQAREAGGSSDSLLKKIKDKKLNDE